MFITPRRLLLIIGLALLTASPSRGEVGVLVLEPVDALGFFTRAGHTGTYFSHICPDGSPVKMRLCHPGEHGGVVNFGVLIPPRAGASWNDYRMPYRGN